MAHSSLRNHRKLDRLCRELDIERPLAVGLLVHLWWSVYEGGAISWDGVLIGWTEQDVASCSLWSGDPEKFVTALVTSEFLDRCNVTADGCNNVTLAIHDLESWAPDFVKKRWTRRGWKGPETRKRQPMADNGGQRRTTADNVRITQPNPTQPKETKDKELPRSKGRASESAPHLPDVKKKDEINLQAEEIYQAYPKHIGHGRAVTAIRKALRLEPFESLLPSVQRYAESVGHAKGTQDWQYVPHPATWFNGERWKDEPDPKARANSNRPPQEPMLIVAARERYGDAEVVEHHEFWLGLVSRVETGQFSKKILKDHDGDAQSLRDQLNPKGGEEWTIE